MKMKKQSKSNINSPSQVGRNTQTQGSRNFNKKSAPFFHYLSNWSLHIKVEEHWWGKEVELDA